MQNVITTRNREAKSRIRLAGRSCKSQIMTAAATHKSQSVNSKLPATAYAARNLQSANRNLQAVNCEPQLITAILHKRKIVQPHERKTEKEY